MNKVYECRYHACSKISNRIEVQLTTSLSSSCLTDPWVFVLLASNRREIPVSRPVKLQKWMNMLVSIIIIMLLLIDHRASTYTSTMLSHDTTVIIRVVVLMECRKKCNGYACTFVLDKNSIVILIILVPCQGLEVEQSGSQLLISIRVLQILQTDIWEGQDGSSVLFKTS